MLEGYLLKSSSQSRAIPTVRMAFQEAGVHQDPLSLRYGLTANSLDFTRRLTAADFCVQSMTGIESKSGYLLLVGSRISKIRSVCRKPGTGISNGFNMPMSVDGRVIHKSVDPHPLHF